MIRRSFAGRHSCLVALLALLMLLSTGCGGKDDNKEYTSYLPPKEATVGTEIKLDDFSSIKINSVQLLTTDGQVIANQDALAGYDLAKEPVTALVDYDWKNLTKKPQNGWDNYLLTCKQSDIKLKPTLSLVEDRKKLVTQAAPEETIEHVQQGFILNDVTGDLQISLDGKVDTVFIDDKPGFAYAVKVPVALSECFAE